MLKVSSVDEALGWLGECARIAAEWVDLDAELFGELVERLYKFVSNMAFCLDLSQKFLKGDNI
jgi:hypothetical protein